MTGDFGSRALSWALSDRLLPPEERKHRWWPFRRLNEWTIPGLLIALAALCIYAWQRSPYFLTVNNLVNIGENISIRGLMAIGLTVLLISGGLDLSIAAVAAFSGMFAAMMINAGINGAVSGLVALACAATMGLINAIVIVRFRVNPIIATLGTLLLFRGLAFVVSGGDNIVIGVNAWSHFGRGEELGVKVTLWVFAGVLVGGMWFMRHSFIGNNLYAIGGNASACRNVGMKVDRIRMWSYVAMAILSGIAGIALMSRGGNRSTRRFRGSRIGDHHRCVPWRRGPHRRARQPAGHVPGPDHHRCHHQQLRSHERPDLLADGRARDDPHPGRLHRQHPKRRRVPLTIPRIDIPAQAGIQSRTRRVTFDALL